MHVDESEAVRADDSHTVLARGSHHAHFALASLRTGLAKAAAELPAVKTRPDFEAAKARYVGPNGELTALMKQMGTVPKEQRPAMGKLINEAKGQLQVQLDAALARIADAELAAQLGPAVDPTLPSPDFGPGTHHPLTLVREEMCRILRKVGFTVADGPEVETEYYCFDALNTGIANFEVRARPDLDSRAAEADVIVASGMWHNGLLDLAPRLKFVQSISSGTDQYDKAEFAKRGIRLASAAGVNARAVAEHAIGLILAMARRIPEARDNQARRVWRGMIGDLTQREDEIGGKTVLIVGTGLVAEALAPRCKAFGMTVIGTKRRKEAVPNVDEVFGASDSRKVIEQSDFLLLLLPATPETDNFVNAERLSWMKPTAWLLNFGRGHLIKDDDLIAAAKNRKIAGAVLDVFRQEPLPADHPFWTAEGIIVLPHIGGPHPQRDRFVARLFVENLGLFLEGKPLRALVDRAAGY